MARPAKYNKEIITKTHEYIVSCDIDEELTQFTTHEGEEGTSWNHKLMKAKMPNLARLAVILGVDRDTITEWRKDHKEFSVACNTILALQEAKLVEGGVAGVYTPSVVTRILAANHGYTDKSGAPALPPPTTNIQNNYALILDPAYKEGLKAYENTVKEAIIKQIKAKRAPQPSPYVESKDNNKS